MGREAKAREEREKDVINRRDYASDEEFAAACREKSGIDPKTRQHILGTNYLCNGRACRRIHPYKRNLAGEPHKCQINPTQKPCECCEFCTNECRRDDEKQKLAARMKRREKSTNQIVDVIWRGRK